MNPDKLQNFPNQLVNGEITECTALTATDIAGNMDGIVYDPDFTYAMTLRLEGLEPTINGADPLTAMQSIVAYGALPASKETFTALGLGELYVSDYKHYPADQVTEALKHQQKGIKSIGIDFDTIKNYPIGVGGEITWFSSWMQPNADGTLPVPSGTTSNHYVAFYGSTIIHGVELLRCKPWLGKEYGDGGYVYMTLEQFKTVTKDTFTFNPAANHWVSIVGIMVTKFPFLADKVSSLIQAQALLPDPVPVIINPQPMPTPVDILHSDVLYPDWSIPAQARHNVRALCDLTGLSAQTMVVDGVTYSKKDVMTACVAIESSFNINAVNRNYSFVPRVDAHGNPVIDPNTKKQIVDKILMSTDNGIAQWNDVYHGKEITPDQALHDPEMAIRLMCKYWLQGLESQWCSFTNGSFKHYL